MFDIKLIRDDIERVKSGLAAKKAEVDLKGIIDIDEERRGILFELDELRSKKNNASDEIGALIKDKKDAKDKNRNQQAPP